METVIPERRKRKKCSICGKYYEGWGNNARPVNDGECCDKCNTEIVVPRRLQDHINQKYVLEEIFNE